MGGPSIVLVINSLLYKSTPVKVLGNFVMITLPESDKSFKTYLLKPSERGHTQEIKEGIENVIKSIVLLSSSSKQIAYRTNDRFVVSKEKQSVHLLYESQSK